MRIQPQMQVPRQFGAMCAHKSSNIKMNGFQESFGLALVATSSPHSDEWLLQGYGEAPQSASFGGIVATGYATRPPSLSVRVYLDTDRGHCLSAPPLYFSWYE